MTKIVKDARVLLKRSFTTGDVPLPGPNDDHTTWTNPNQIYEGEYYVNMIDNKSWIRLTGDTMAEMAMYDLTTGLIPAVHLPPSEYTSTLDPGLEVPNDVGGIVEGTTVADLDGKTFTQMFDELLFPTVLAYININFSATLAGQSSSTQEVGTSIIANTTATFVPGVINNGDNTTGPNLKGDANQYIFRLPDNSIDLTVGASSNSQGHIFTSYVTTFGSNTWTVDISYDAGSGLYYDNKGNPVTNLDGSRSLGTTSPNSGTVTGRRYQWNGSGTGGSAPTASAGVRSLSSKSFLSGSNTGVFTITIPAATQEVYFYVPAGKTIQVLYVESSYADVTSTFTSGSISVDDANGDPQNYESYVAFIGVGGYPSVANYQVTIS